MEAKKNNTPNTTIARTLTDIDKETGNIYESVMIMAKRANQIGGEVKQELTRKLAEFSTTNDSLEETFENREQIEISKYYEKMPKAVLVATEEFLNNKTYYRKADE